MLSSNITWSWHQSTRAILRLPWFSWPTCCWSPRAQLNRLLHVSTIWPINMFVSTGIRCIESNTKSVHRGARLNLSGPFPKNDIDHGRRLKAINAIPVTGRASSANHWWTQLWRCMGLEADFQAVRKSCRDSHSKDLPPLAKRRDTHRPARMGRGSNHTRSVLLLPSFSSLFLL